MTLARHALVESEGRVHLRAMHLKFALLVVPVLLSQGCGPSAGQADGGTDTAGPSILGTWVREPDATLLAARMVLTGTESGGSLTGSARLVVESAGPGCVGESETVLAWTRTASQFTFGAGADRFTIVDCDDARNNVPPRDSDQPAQTFGYALSDETLTLTMGGAETTFQRE